VEKSVGAFMFFETSQARRPPRFSPILIFAPESNYAFSRTAPRKSGP
jgi:hypothetical protein